MDATPTRSITMDQQLALSPTNLNALVNKGYACIQVGAFEQAIPPLTQVLAVDTNNYSALLNRAIAYLRADKLEPPSAITKSCKRPFRPLSRSTTAWLKLPGGRRTPTPRSGTTNSTWPMLQTNTAEAKLVSERLKELKPGSP